MFWLTPRRVICGVLMAFSGMLAQARVSPPDVEQPRPAARVNDATITIDDLDAALGGQVARLDEQIYRLRRQRLDIEIDRRLLAQEAARRGLSPQELMQREIADKVAPVTELEIDGYIEKNKAHLTQATGKARESVRRVLRQQKQDARQEEFIASLRRSASVEILLSEPPSLRTTVSVDGAFSVGPDSAPVTIVEFTDYHCPFCQRAHATIAMVMAKYRGRVKLVHRDFPVDELHPDARAAHVAARCAASQQAFWEYREHLLTHTAVKGREALTAIAKSAGLDVTAFGACLARGTFADAVARDIAEGTRLGVTATPTYFINGRRLQGARPLEAFVRLIDEELAAAENRGRR